MKRGSTKWICAVMFLVLAGVTVWFGRSASAATLEDSQGASVSAIVKSVVADQTVYTLSSNITNGLTITLADGETAILNGNGNTVSGRDATTVIGEVGNGSAGLTVNGNGTLIIRNITIKGGKSADNIYNTPYPGVVVSNECSIRLESGVHIHGGDAGTYKPTDGALGNSGGAGMEFLGNDLWVTGSVVFIQGGRGGNNGKGGDALLWSGRVYGYEQKAAVLTPGNGGSAMVYERGLIQAGAAEIDDLGTVTINQVAGETILSTRNLSYNTASTISDLDTLPFTTMDGYRFLGVYSDAALTIPITVINSETEVVYYAFERVANSGPAIVANRLNCTLRNAIIQCEYSTQGENCQKAFLAVMPQGCVEAFAFNLLLQENGSFQPGYALRNGQFVMEIPKEWQKKGRTFALIGVDRSGKTKIFTDEDISDETFTTSLDIEGYAYSLIYSDTDAIPASGRYAVQAGDSLSRIARKLQVSISHLVIKNKLSNPNKIQVGQELFY